MFKVTARDQGHYKGHSGAFVTYCNISCFSIFRTIMAIVLGVPNFRIFTVGVIKSVVSVCCECSVK